MHTERAAATATLLGDGRVLVAGEQQHAAPPVVSSAELYDPASGTWSSAGDMTTTRYHQAAVLLPDGRVLMVGGLTDIPNPTAASDLFTLLSTSSVQPGDFRCLCDVLRLRMRGLLAENAQHGRVV